MHGLEPQTLESINLLKEKKCPFIVALNKVRFAIRCVSLLFSLFFFLFSDVVCLQIDRLYDWKKSPETDVVATLKKQKKNTKDEFDERVKAVIVEFAQQVWLLMVNQSWRLSCFGETSAADPEQSLDEPRSLIVPQGLNAALFYENKDPRTFVSLIPTSAHSGDGMGNLIALLVELTQTMLARRLAHCDELRAQVMEVRESSLSELCSRATAWSLMRSAPSGESSARHGNHD